LATEYLCPWELYEGNLEPPMPWVLVPLSLGRHEAYTDFHLVLRLRMGGAHSPASFCVTHRDKFTSTFLLAGVEEKGI
jgi:hypothetical protein